VNVADWTAALRAADRARIERHLRCLACNGPVEKSLSALGSLRCLACRETNAPLDPELFSESHPNSAKL
jgi:hypothetical protein